MSKETIKLYSHDGTLVKVAEFYKNDLPELGWRLGWFESYQEAKDDLEFKQRVDFAIPNCDDKIKEDIKNLKNDLDVIRRLEQLEDHRFELIDKEQVHFSERIEQLSRKLNGKDNRLDSLSDKIDNIKKESKRGEDLLLGRMIEIERELDRSKTKLKPKRERKNKKELNIFEIILAIGICWFLGFGLFFLVN